MNEGAFAPAGPTEIPSFLQAEGQMAQLITSHTWAPHPLGPISHWPQSLKTAVSLILNSQHPMWIGWGPHMSFLYNDAYLHVLGMAKHPWALGRPAAEVWAEIWDFCGPLAAKVFERGEASFVDDVQLFMRRGSFLEETFYSFSYSPIRGESGEVAGLFCPSNDVTAKVVGARRLETLAELVANALAQKSTGAACALAAETLAKNTSDVPFAAIYLVDGERCERLEVAGPPDTARLLPARVPVDPARAGGITRCIAAVVQSGHSERFVLDAHVGATVTAPGGTVVEAIVLPIAGRAEVRPLGALVAGISPARPLDAEYAAFFDLVASNIGTAITNARAAEEERRQVETLAAMDRAKTEFFSNVSHEFRTPLTLMLGPLEQLAGHGDDSSRALAQTARRNALRLLKLVNTLLEFSRLEAGRSDAMYAPTDLAALTRDVASAFRSAIESVGLRFTVDVELDEPVYVDRSMWERIVLNLLSNALKFTFDGTIDVRLRRSGESAILTVSDSGVGIAEHELPHLFERFHRVRGTQSRSHEGSGIGLALVRDLTALHGGEVSVESRLGMGTAFHVRIPIGDAHLDRTRIVAATGPGAFPSAVEQYLADVAATVTRTSERIAPPTRRDDARSRVLLADDNADLREYVSGILADRYAVTAVTNGREALAALRDDAFDLVVSDVMMPEMDGFELLSAVRNDERLAPTPFVLLSARAGEESALEGLRQGADDYIVKPFSADQLLARVQAQLTAKAIRERATAEVRASEERFRTLAASLSNIVLEADATGAVTFLSDAYATYTGRSVDTDTGDAWMETIVAEDAETVRTGWRAARSAGELFSADVRLRRHDGAERWFAASILPQRDPEGNVFRWIGTLADVHEQRLAAQERDFLARASDVLAQPLGLQQTLGALARIAVPALGDWCRIDLRSDDGTIVTVAIAHSDSEKDRIAQRFVGERHPNPDAEHGSAYVIRAGRSELGTGVTRDFLNRNLGLDRGAAIAADLGVSTYVAVPLVADHQTFGMLAVVNSTIERRHTADDLPLIEELGRRAGIAIHKARLFEREQRAAESFQRASLPADLPQTPGLVLDAYYAPGRAEAQVGGDWYDALRLLDGRIVVSIGDVAGSGLNAAVTMGNMRQIIRGIAQVHADPALMLDAADRALRLEHPDTFVTAFVGVFDPIDGTLTYASAGHPPPLWRLPTGTVEALAETGLPLGLRSNGERGISTTLAMPVGSALVLYTDGLIEHGRDLAGAEQALCGIIAELDVHRATARGIVEQMMPERGARDDVAVMVAGVRDPRDGASGTIEWWTLDTHDHAAVGAARHAFTTSFLDHGGCADDVAMAEMVFGELVSNVVRYAPGALEVVADWSGPSPVLHVLDRGPGFGHIAILPPDLLSESGRGLFIVATLTDDFRAAKRPSGGSHARAVLRVERRRLAGGGQSTSRTLLHALAGGLNVIAE